MSDLHLLCPICGKNFMQSFECEHDETDLADRIRELEAELDKAELAYNTALARLAAVGEAKGESDE